MFVQRDLLIHSRAQYLAAVARKISALPSPFPNLAVLSVVLPNLAALRQAYGHESAESVVAQACAAIRSIIPETFVGQAGDGRILLTYEYDPEWTDLDDVAAELRDVVDNPKHGRAISLATPSVIGAAAFDGKGAPGTALDMATALLRRADLAAALALKNERRFCLYSESQDAQIRDATMLEQHLRQAVVRSEFLLHYQPSVDLVSSEVVALEALIRWQSPVRGLRSPDEFIPIAEASGLIVQIGATVIDVAVGQIRAWMDNGWTPPKVAINVSAAQLMDRDFPSLVSRALKREQVDPSQIELEVTERTLIADPATTRGLLTELRRRGIGVALDDFGVGYSSLQYLRDLPISKIKIDRSFVRDVATDKRDLALVKTVVTLGEALGLDVVAEGIETALQLEAVRECGCSVGQGFLFSRPQPALLVPSLQGLIREGAERAGRLATARTLDVAGCRNV